MPSGHRSGLPPWLAALLLLLLPLLLLGDGLLPGNVLAGAGTENRLPWSATATEAEAALPQVNADTIRENLVYRVILTEHVREGQLPIWSSGMFGGVPYLALNHTQVLYPPALLASVFDPLHAYGLLIAAHLALAGLAMFAFLRSQGLSVEAALIGAILFQLNGMFATRMGHPQFLSTGAWLPLLGLATQWLFQRRWALGIVGLACFTCMMVLAGHPSIYVYGSYFVGGWLLLRLLWVEAPSTWRERGLIALAFSLAFALGLALASGQLLATIELAGFSAREERSVDGLARRLSHSVHLLRILFPEGTGAPRDLTYFSPSFTSYTAGTLYVGVPGLMLAGIGALGGGRRGRGLALLAIMSLLILFWPPVFRLAYHLLPGFRFSRADRFSIVWFLAMANLAAVGVDVLRAQAHRAPRWRDAFRPIWGWWLLAGAAGVVALLVVPQLAELRLSIRPMADDPLIHLRPSVLWGLGLAGLSGAWWALYRRYRHPALFGALVLLLLIDLGGFLRRQVVVRDAERLLRSTPELAFLQNAPGPARIAKLGGHQPPNNWTILPANLPAAFGLDDLHGFGPLHVQYIDTLVAPLDRRPNQSPWHLRPLQLPAAALSATLDVANIRYVLTPETLDLPLAFEGSFRIYENTDALPRTSWVPDAVVRDDTEAALALAASTVDPRQVVQLSEAVTHPQPAPGQVSVTPVERGPWWFTVDTSGPGGGWLRLSESWYPGWVAEIDGVAHPTLRADVAFQVIPLTPGDHRVRFTYRPTWLQNAALLTGLSTFSLLGICLWGWSRRKDR